MNHSAPKTLGSAKSSSRWGRSFRCCRGLASKVPKIAMQTAGANETTL
jgi:hypothetical protein